MRPEAIVDSDNVTLRQAIERQIDERTWGRVHRLDVQVCDDCVRVQGYTTSYYIKQLTIQAILDVLGQECLREINLDIAVGSGVNAANAGQSRK